MDDKTKATIKGSIIGSVISAFITVAGSIFIHIHGDYSKRDTIEKATVETLSEYFDSVNKDMSYQQALQTLYKDSVQKDEEINILNEQNGNYEKQLANMPKIEFKNTALVIDGLGIQDNINKSVILIDNNYYFSSNLLNMTIQDKLFYDPNQDTVYYNTAEDNIFTETKIDLFDTDVLYDGACFRTFLPSDGDSFSMGSSTYNKGFTVYDDHSLFGAGDGFALFDLQGLYSKISFDVGRTNEYNMDDVTLKVYINNEYVEEYVLSGQSPPISLDIDLNYAKNLKLEIIGGYQVKYGFANAFLYY